MVKKVVVASKNPVKIAAVIDGFQRMLPDEVFEFVSVSVESGVPDQPKGDRQTYNGALNRAINAQSMETNAEYCVGLEGGVEDIDGEMATFAWIVVAGGGKTIGKARTSTLFLPKKVSDLVHEGYELGEADDIVFKKENSKQANGAIGLLTHDVLDRRTSYSNAVILALIPYKNPKYY